MSIAFMLTAFILKYMSSFESEYPHGGFDRFRNSKLYPDCSVYGGGVWNGTATHIFLPLTFRRASHYQWMKWAMAISKLDAHIPFRVSSEFENFSSVTPFGVDVRAFVPFLSSISSSSIRSHLRFASISFDFRLIRIEKCLFVSQFAFLEPMDKLQISMALKFSRIATPNQINLITAAHFIRYAHIELCRANGHAQSNASCNVHWLSWRTKAMQTKQPLGVFLKHALIANRCELTLTTAFALPAMFIGRWSFSTLSILSCLSSFTFAIKVNTYF